MGTKTSKIFALSLLLAGACAATTPKATPKPAAAPALRVQLATVYVDDQDKALRFYTEVLGFTKQDDETNGGYRWLTVGAPDDPRGAQLLLALNADPAAKAHQQAMLAHNQPAAMLFTGDIQRVYEGMKARGAAFTMPPTEVMPGATITTLNDTCGNLIQITQLDR